MFWIKALIALIGLVAFSMFFSAAIVYRGGPMDVSLGQLLVIGAVTVVQIIIIFGVAVFSSMSRD